MKFNKNNLIVMTPLLLLWSCVIKMPIEKGIFKENDLVEIIKLDSTIKLDVRYAGDNNFIGKPIYKEARAFLQRPAAEALVLVHEQLKKDGYGLLIFDGYRPWDITKVFWDSTSRENKKFVANPRKGSKHNRGCAVDLSLYDLKTGTEVEMGGLYDEMSERSYPKYEGGTEEQRKSRELLIQVMESNGFKVYDYEWWHFDFNDWKSYRINNIPFSAIK